MATIRDVAQRAGVSTMTVSRVLNSSGYVSADARARVESAVSDLGYVSNTLGVSLRFKRTQTLALVVTDITNPYFTSMARGVEDVASRAGFSTILCNTDESGGQQADYLTFVSPKAESAGGLLHAGAGRGASVQWLQQNATLRSSLIDREGHRRACWATVRGQSEAGGHDLAALLYDLGHREIAMLTGPAYVSTAADRVAGFLRASHGGVAPAPDHVVYGNFTVPSGYTMTQQVLKLVPRPTALLAANNFIAIGAFRALRDAGLRVPEDVSLVAYDNLPDHMVLDPFLTVVAQPAYEMGTHTAEACCSSGSRVGAPPNPNIRYQEIKSWCAGQAHRLQPAQRKTRSCPPSQRLRRSDSGLAGLLL